MATVKIIISTEQDIVLDTLKVIADDLPENTLTARIVDLIERRFDVEE